MPEPKHTKDHLFLRPLLDTPEGRTVIDRTYPLQDVVETFRKSRSVVITVSGAER